MLRLAISAVAILWVGIALLMAVVSPLHWPMLVMAVLVSAGCLFERRYHAGHAPPSDGRFVPTNERFIDPETGRPMTVWADPRTGERRYGTDGEVPILRR